MQSRRKVSIVVPTYNERDNVPLLVDGIHQALTPSYEHEVIVVDDNSPDGTQDVVRAMQRDDSSLRLIGRPGKLGLGTAIVAGFREASGEAWVMMDADLSHRPEDLPAVLSGLGRADIVIGSRHVPGGSIQDWPLFRRFVSSSAAKLGRVLIGASLHDITSGFVAYRREVLEPLLPHLHHKGFKLLLEVLSKAENARVAEVPITFVDRRYGQSKFSQVEVVRYLRLCLQLRGSLRHLRPPASDVAPIPAPEFLRPDQRTKPPEAA